MAQQPLSPPERKPARATALAQLLARFGPMCLVSVAALDPGNLEVDVQAGARSGYTLMWAIVYASVCGALLQNAAAQLAVITRLDLAELCALEYADAPFVRIALVVVAQLSVIAFDVAEVLGVAFALYILCNCPLWLGCVASAADTLLILHLQSRGRASLEIAIEALLAVLAAAILYELVASRPDVGAIARATALPSLGSKPREAALLAVGLLGSLVMAHNLFLHSWVVKQRARSRDAHTLPARIPPDNSALDAECRETAVDTALVFTGACIVNGAVLAVSAALFYPRRAERAFQSIGLVEASALLRAVLGSRIASVAWAVALLCSGHAATVTGTLASQAVLEGFLRPGDTDGSRLFSLATRAVAIVPAVAAALVAGAKGADKLIVASQIVLSFALPFAAVPAIRFLRATRASARWLILASFVAFAFVAVANVTATAATALDVFEAHRLGAAANALLAALAAAYLYVLAVLCMRPLRLPAILAQAQPLRPPPLVGCADTAKVDSSYYDSFSPVSDC